MNKGRWVSILVLLVSMSIVGVLYYYSHYKPHTYEQYLITNIGALLWLPVMLIVFVFRQELSNFGFGVGDGKAGYRLAGLLFLAVLPAYVIAARMPAFQGYYPIQKWAAKSLADFAYFELSYGMYLFAWEFFFRGFMLFGLARLIGPWSVFVQAVAFGIMHYGKPGPEFVVSFAAGVVLGFLALRAKSFLPCFVLHWASAVIFDVLVILAGKGMLF